MSRPIHEIAAEIRSDWKNVFFGAVPYLDAMEALDAVTDKYYLDSAPSVVRYFLSNATRWKGETAKRVKKELNDMIKGKYASDTGDFRRKFGPVRRTAGDAPIARFEKGKATDPTKNMSDEDAAEWGRQNEENKDRFKKAAEQVPRAVAGKKATVPHDIRPGTIFFNRHAGVSWYEVTKVRNVPSRYPGEPDQVRVTIREVASKILRSDVDSETVVPVPGKVIGRTQTRQVSFSHGQPTIKLVQWSIGRVWDGLPMDIEKNYNLSEEMAKIRTDRHEADRHKVAAHHMNEDAAEWKRQNEEHKDNFKKSMKLSGSAAMTFLVRKSTGPGEYDVHDPAGPGRAFATVDNIGDVLRDWAERRIRLDSAGLFGPEFVSVDATIPGDILSKIRRFVDKTGQATVICDVRNGRWIVMPKPARFGNTSGPTRTAAHHMNEDGKWYVDTAFINAVQHVYPGANLRHMGFGEFTMETPDGEMEFDRMRGEDMPFEGQSGRSHLIYDNKNGKVVEKAISLMEKAHKSVKTAFSKKAGLGDRATIEELVDMRVETLGGHAENDISTRAFQAIERLAAEFESDVQNAMFEWFSDHPVDTDEAPVSRPLGPKAREEQISDFIRKLDDAARGGVAYLYYMETEGHGVGTWDGDWDKFFPDRSDIRKLSQYVQNEFQVRRSLDKFNAALEDAVSDVTEPPDWTGYGSHNLAASTVLAGLDMDLTEATLPGVTVDRSARALEHLARATSLDRTASNLVGAVILEQMGGIHRLKAMLGVHYLRYLPNGVEFGWPNKTSTKGNHVKVVLLPSDTYRVEFFKTAFRSLGRGTKIPGDSKVVKRLDDVYAEDLVDIFERQTGWYLRLASSGVRALLELRALSAGLAEGPVTAEEEAEGSQLPGEDGMSKRAEEFKTQDAYDKYLKEHPGADKSKHKVVKTDHPDGKKDEGGKTDEDGKKKDTAPGSLEGIKDWPHTRRIEARRLEIKSKDLQDYPEGTTIDKLKPEHKAELDAACKDEKRPTCFLPDVVGDDAITALEILRQSAELGKALKAIDADTGLSGKEKEEKRRKLEDVCRASRPVCAEHKDLTRDKMPQIESDAGIKEMRAAMPDDKKYEEITTKVRKAQASATDDAPFRLEDVLPDKKEREPWLSRAKAEAAIQAGADPDSDVPIFKQFIDALGDSGTSSSVVEIAAGDLFATQSEILTGKTFGMALGHFTGKDHKGKPFSLEGGDKPIIVSKDGHILDGHHRWSALITIDPGRKMKVKQIDMTMDELLQQAAEHEGVYKADFQGVPLPEEDQKKYKADNPKGKKHTKTDKTGSGPCRRRDHVHI